MRVVVQRDSNDGWHNHCRVADAAMTDLSMDQIQARMGRVNLFAIFMRPTDKYDVSTAQGQELMRQHLQFQLDLEDRGVLLAAGPLNLQAPAPIGRPSADLDPIVDASGMYLVAVTSRDAAEAIAASEPFERAGWRTHTVCSWMLNEGAAVPLARRLVDSTRKD